MADDELFLSRLILASRKICAMQLKSVLGGAKRPDLCWIFTATF
jgi:hypothetical protein